MSAKITVSFRILPKSKERILNLGGGSFSQGVEVLLKNFRPNKTDAKKLIKAKLNNYELLFGEVYK